VIGVEKFTDAVGTEVESAIAQTMDYDFEGMQGMTTTGAAAMLMQRYLYEYHPPRDVFGQLAMIAHANAVSNPNAFFRRAITLEDYQRAGMVCDPLNLYDVAPYADGAAAALITRRDLLPKDYPHRVIKIAASSLVTDALSLHDRSNPLAFEAARLSAQRALSKAGIEINQIDLFEYWDAFSIYAILELEAAGFAAPGEGWKLAQAGKLTLQGQLPVATLGGLKARGYPLGATTLYQIADAVTQLRGSAGQNQVRDAKTAMVQSLGGAAATAVTHILQT
jgi:acetyl-CoA C-acetyltransferase